MFTKRNELQLKLKTRHYQTFNSKKKSKFKKFNKFH